MRLPFLLLLAAATAGAARRRDSMPLLFVPNHGQAPPEVRYVVKSMGVIANSSTSPTRSRPAATG
jgi:hypothetical protein